MENTRKYLKKLKREIGFLRAEHNDSVKDLRNPKTVVISEDLKVNLGQTEGGQWSAQFGQGYYEDPVFTSYIFNRKPSIEDIRIADEIEDVGEGIRLAMIDPWFTCSACGEEKHWTEIEGDIFEKSHQRKSRWCGCNAVNVNIMKARGIMKGKYNDQVLPRVEIGDIVELGDVWYGEGAAPTESYAYQIAEAQWINYMFEIVEEKEDELETLVKITGIELM